ncbi:ATPase family associated with various cellular activities (AAA) [Prevotellaceae bacterium HUN156]|nr:ATPase family associated with various cellular activities (AAA) [Prevotellaceae bacterium HUN156]
MDLFTAIEQIVDLAKDSQLNKEFYRKADKYIKYVSEKMELTKEQSVMMALFVNRSDDNHILIRYISGDINCPTIRILRYLKDIEELEKKEFIRCCRERRGKISYRVPYDVIEAFKRDEKYVPRKCTNLTCAELFSELEDIFELRQDNEITFDAMCQKVKSLLNDNPQLQFTKAIKQQGWEDIEEELMLFLLFCHLYVNNNDNNIRFHDLDFLYDDKRIWNRVKNELARGSHELFAYEIIENNNDDGMVDRESFRLAQKGKDEYLSELDLRNRANNDQRKDIVKCEKIVEKKLFYGKNIQVQIDELSQLLDKPHYQEVHTRMKDSGFRCGFTCLFYGAPGTGKTETVLQLARKTGRDIMLVNISQIKSCWVGESEKNIKRLFDNYRELVKKSEVTPILLFNEADAIINKRMEGAQSAVNKMENSMQNIILQEMENLDGILIATTNLAGNMDKAFERRFLYKIKFEKPTLEARMSIWHTMIPSLEENVTRALATKYDFSGGQIENIARHYTIGNILHGKSENIIEELSSYCDSERLETKEMRKIGF